MNKKTGIITLFIGLFILAIFNNSYVKAFIGNAESQKELLKVSLAEKNHKEYRYWLKRLANSGDVKASKELGLLHYQNKDYADAFYWLKEPAISGDAESMLFLAKTLLSESKKEKNINNRWYITAVSILEETTTKYLDSFYSRQAFKLLGDYYIDIITNSNVGGDLEFINMMRNRALNYYYIAFSYGDLNSAESMAKYHYKNKNYKKSYAWFDIGSIYGDLEFKELARNKKIEILNYLSKEDLKKSIVLSNKLSEVYKNRVYDLSKDLTIHLSHDNWRESPVIKKGYKHYLNFIGKYN